MMEAYASSVKLDLASANSLLHSHSHSHSHSTSSVESSPQSSSATGGGGELGKRKTCGAGGNNLITSSVTGLTSDLSSLYALENLHHHHSSLPHHSHPTHSGLLVGGASTSSSIITPATSSSQSSIQSGSTGSLIAAGSTLGLPGKLWNFALNAQSQSIKMTLTKAQPLEST